MNKHVCLLTVGLIVSFTLICGCAHYKKSKKEETAEKGYYYIPPAKRSGDVSQTEAIENVVEKERDKKAQSAPAGGYYNQQSPQDTGSRSSYYSVSEEKAYENDSLKSTPSNETTSAGYYYTQSGQPEYLKKEVQKDPIVEPVKKSPETRSQSGYYQQKSTDRPAAIAPKQAPKKEVPKPVTKEAVTEAKAPAAPATEPETLDGAQLGTASYYGDKFQDKKTASGELYDREKMTAAHRTHPFGTRLKVTNVANGKSVIVTVNDRGPFAKGRVVDLSYKAMTQLDGIGAGLIDVKVEVIK